MILEEIEKQARQEAKSYKTVYSEDFRFDEVMKDPLRFDQDYPKCLYLLLKEKHYRDGFQDGAKWGYDRALKELYEKLALHNTQLSLTVVVEKINQMGVQV